MISLIFAMDKNNLIGRGNDLPWHYSEDLKYFKQTTLNKKVIMGKKTFYSIVNRLNHPLLNRYNIVATLDKNFKYDDVLVINDLESFLKQISNEDEEYFVIGGKSIYDISIKYADRLYITFIDKEYVGDVYFSEIDYSKYTKIQSTHIEELEFAIFEKNKKE